MSPVGVGLLSGLALYLIQIRFRNANSETLPGGYLLQEWPSEQMMQNLGLADMFAYGPMSLWFKHVYPPLQDAFRYFFSLPELVHGFPPNYAAVDLNMYKLYALCFGVVNAVVYVWVRDVTRSGWWALAITTLWAIGPGFLTNMMLLDPTPLAMAFISISYLMLFFFLKYRDLWFLVGFFWAFWLASLARSFTQLHVLIFLIALAATCIVIARKRSALSVTLVVFGVGALWIMPLKQQMLFSTWDTSTFAGYHRSGTLWIDPHTVPEPDFPAETLGNGEEFQSRWNTTDTLRDNYRLEGAATSRITGSPIAAVTGAARSLTITVPELLRPSSQYVDNYLVAEIPWRGIYDWLFSSWRYGALVLGAVTAFVWMLGVQGTLGWVRRYGWFLGFFGLMAVPILWSNRFIVEAAELGPIWTDAVRLKLLLEVPLAVLMTTTLWMAVRRLRTLRASRGQRASESA